MAEHQQPILPKLSDVEVSRLLMDTAHLDYHLTANVPLALVDDLIPELDLSSLGSPESEGAPHTAPLTPDGLVPMDAYLTAISSPASSGPLSPPCAVPHQQEELEASLAHCLAAMDLPDPAATIHISGYLNGYRHPVRVVARRDTPTVELRRLILDKQARTHPHPIPEEHYGRVMLLTSQPTTMNTSCKFSEDSVIHDTNLQGVPLTVADLNGIQDIYIYLLCPEPPLVTERTSHRRLAKRAAGVCEAHRGQRSKRKAYNAGHRTGRAFSVPALRARITRESGEKLSLDDVDRVKALWKAKLPDLMKGFLQEQGLSMEEVKWTGSRKGSVVLDFDLVFFSLEPQPVSKPARLSYMERFEEYLAQLEPEFMAAAVAPLEVSHFGFIDTFEDYHSAVAVAVKQRPVGLQDHIVPLTDEGVGNFFRVFLPMERAYSCVFHNEILRIMGADESLFLQPEDIVLNLQRDATVEPPPPPLEDGASCIMREAPSNSIAYCFRSAEESFTVTGLPTDVDAEGRLFTLAPFRYPGREETSIPLDSSNPLFASLHDFIPNAKRTFCRIQNDLIRCRSLDRRYEVSVDNFQFYAEYGSYSTLPKLLGITAPDPAPVEEAAFRKSIEGEDVLRIVLGFSPEAVLRTASDSLLT